MKRVKKQYPEDFKSLMGFSLPGLSVAFTTVIFSMFMQYLTDYSGIDAAVGQVGYAAGFGTIFLVVSRIIDAVDDPLQAFIMDNAKERKFGKYRFFTTVGILLILVGLIAMFAIPEGVKTNKVLLAVWVFFWYFVYEMGTAFNGIYPIMQKSTTDARVRTKLMTWHRMFLVIGAVPAALFVPIATVLNASAGLNDMGKAVSLTCTIVVIVATAVSLVGIACLREPMRKNLSDESVAQKTDEEKIHVRDVIRLFRTNKAMWIHNLGFVIGNSAAGFAGMIIYFLKWEFFADQTTGTVDNVGYAASYGAFTTLSLIVTFLAPLLAGWVTKKIGAVDRSARVCMLAAGVIYAVTYILYLTGGLKSPVVLVGLLALASIPTGMATIPFLLLNVEAADYTEYRTGKNMTQMTNAVYNLVTKFSSAINTAITGALLAFSHYSVDSVTGAYAGDLSQLPNMVDRLAVCVTLVPAACALVSWLIYKVFYPITPETREKMVAELNRRHEEQSA